MNVARTAVHAWLGDTSFLMTTGANTLCKRVVRSTGGSTTTVTASAIGRLSYLPHSRPPHRGRRIPKHLWRTRLTNFPSPQQSPPTKHPNTVPKHLWRTRAFPNRCIQLPRPIIAIPPNRPNTADLNDLSTSGALWRRTLNCQHHTFQ